MFHELDARTARTSHATDVEATAARQRRVPVPAALTSRRILVVEDDPDITALLSLHLRDAGWEVEVAGDGCAGTGCVTTRSFDAIILDLTLPGIDGLTLCRTIRQQAWYTTVLMLTARSGEVDRVVGLELGADDYLVKPFSVRELVARLKALFRRGDALADQHADRSPTHLLILDLSIDVSKRRVERGGRLVALTPKEFDLLLFLAREPGRVYTRTQLLEQVWGYGYDGYGHAVNTHINRLRSKIEDDPASPRFVLTVWGVGYTFHDVSTSD